MQGVAEQVVVDAAAPLLQTATAEISDVIENREVVQLPLNGRNFLALAQLSDAVVLPPGGTRGEALQQAGPLPNVGGQRSGHNIYLLDGTKVTDELFNNLVINPSVDSIEEFKIQKSMYTAEFGGKASALINVATRAGSNAFRGSLFEFHRDDAFDAPNYFQPDGEPLPPLRQDQFGGALGGPLRRNRSFFFGSAEAPRMKPLADARPSRCRRWRRAAATSARLGADLRSADHPATGVCTPFPDNRIPGGPHRSDRRGPARARAAADIGRGVQNLAAVEELDRDLTQFSLRLDHRLTSADQLFARFSTFDADEIQPFGTSALQESLVPGLRAIADDRTRATPSPATRASSATRC